MVPIGERTPAVAGEDARATHLAGTGAAACQHFFEESKFPEEEREKKKWVKAGGFLSGEMAMLIFVLYINMSDWREA